MITAETNNGLNNDINKNSREEIISVLEKRIMAVLSVKRAKHTIGVADECVRLGRIFLPEESIHDIRCAGLLHDVTKELSPEEHRKMCEKYGYELSRYDVLAKGILHSISGSLAAKHEFGMSDEICNAIRYHTTGKADMTTFEKILFIADYIEAGRTEKVCVSMRNNLYKQLSKAKNYADKLYVLDKCIFVTLNNTLNELIENYKFIHTDTVEARNYYMLLFNDSF